LIAGEPLNVTVPEGIIIEAETGKERPEPLPYPSNEKARMRHYGQNVQALIKAAMAMEDGPERDLATYTAAYYMKVALSSWNQGKFVNEEMIRKDLYELSERQLVLPPNAQIGVPGPNQPAQHADRRKKKKKKNKNRQQVQAAQPKVGGSSSRSKNRRNKRRR
ncbi:MAG: DUF4290 domain-containing protein, partial [Bacteroidota bacterium]